MTEERFFEWSVTEPTRDNLAVTRCDNVLATPPHHVRLPNGPECRARIDLRVAREQRPHWLKAAVQGSVRKRH
jgi:hypothetical protein